MNILGVGIMMGFLIALMLMIIFFVVKYAR